MTEKRFINDIDIGQLIDTKGELSTIYYSDKVDFYGLWEFLNKLSDENEQLKTQLQNTSDQRNEFHRGARENANRIEILEKENKQLKEEKKLLFEQIKAFRDGCAIYNDFKSVKTLDKLIEILKKSMELFE